MNKTHEQERACKSCAKKVIRATYNKTFQALVIFSAVLVVFSVLSINVSAQEDKEIFKGIGQLLGSILQAAVSILSYTITLPGHGSMPLFVIAAAFIVIYVIIFLLIKHIPPFKMGEEFHRGPAIAFSIGITTAVIFLTRITEWLTSFVRAGPELVLVLGTFVGLIVLAVFLYSRIRAGVGGGTGARGFDRAPGAGGVKGPGFFANIKKEIASAKIERQMNSAEKNLLEKEKNLESKALQVEQVKQAGEAVVLQELRLELQELQTEVLLRSEMSTIESQIQTITDPQTQQALLQSYQALKTRYDAYKQRLEQYLQIIIQQINALESKEKQELGIEKQEKGLVEKQTAAEKKDEQEEKKQYGSAISPAQKAWVSQKYVITKKEEAETARRGQEIATEETLEKQEIAETGTARKEAVAAKKEISLGDIAGAMGRIQRVFGAISNVAAKSKTETVVETKANVDRAQQAQLTKKDAALAAKK